MRRVLIVDESETLVRVISTGCFAEDDVSVCTDGIKALCRLVEVQPEILVINMSLPYKDGLAVLREAAYLPRQVIASCYMTNPYLARILMMLGVQYVLYMPTLAGARQALKVIERTNTGIRADLRQLVVEHLRRLGIPTNMDGYQMLTVGLPLYYRDPSQPLVKELYPAIAYALEQGTAQTVERSIRKAIEHGWRNRSDSVWEQYFGRDAKGQIRCPTNKRFVTALVGRLEQELEKI